MFEKNRQSTDYHPLFSEFPDDCRKRWTLIREFIRRWHGLDFLDTDQQERIQAIETALGYPLPLSCRQWVALVYDLLDADVFQYVFRDCLSFSELPGHAAVSLLIQGEGDYHWAVNKCDLALEDPPVDGFQLDYEGDSNSFIFENRWASRTSNWALQFILSYLYICSGHSLGTSIADPKKLDLQLSSFFVLV